jgi:hypothetical protein
MSNIRSQAGVAVAVLLFVAGAFAQRGRGRFTSITDAPAYSGDADFHFLRLAFSDGYGFSRGFGFASRGTRLVDRGFPRREDSFSPASAA